MQRREHDGSHNRVASRNDTDTAGSHLRQTSYLHGYRAEPDKTRETVNSCPSSPASRGRIMLAMQNFMESRLTMTKKNMAEARYPSNTTTQNSDRISSRHGLKKSDTVQEIDNAALSRYVWTTAQETGRRGPALPMSSSTVITTNDYPAVTKWLIRAVTETGGTPLVENSRATYSPADRLLHAHMFVGQLRNHAGDLRGAVRSFLAALWVITKQQQQTQPTKHGTTNMDRDELYSFLWYQLANVYGRLGEKRNARDARKQACGFGSSDSYRKSCRRHRTTIRRNTTPLTTVLERLSSEFRAEGTQDIQLVPEHVTDEETEADTTAAED